MIHLTLNNQSVGVAAGELISYQVDGYEFIHQKGSPGWRNSDTEMFPIIGPTAEAKFQVKTPRGVAIQDQHGLLRELEYHIIKQTEDAVIYEKNYSAGSKVNNSKYPDKSSVKELFWPYSFKFQKAFELQGDGLRVTFAISGDEGMPFMLGYHPAFKLRGTNPLVISDESTIPLSKIIEVGSRALLVSNTEAITLRDDRSLKIITEGFGNFMLWTEVDNMVCIEPITFYPYAVDQQHLHEGFREYEARGEGRFSVKLRPM